MSGSAKANNLSNKICSGGGRWDIGLCKCDELLFLVTSELH